MTADDRVTAEGGVPAGFSAPDPHFRERVRHNFGNQAFMSTLDAELVRVEPGRVAIRLPARPDLTQQHGYVHAGVVTSIADSACGYAAFTLMPEGSNVLTVEFKVHLLRPADGAALEARAEVVRAGRTLSVCRADVFAVGRANMGGGDHADEGSGSESNAAGDGERTERHVAMMTCTIMRVAG